MQQDIKTPSEYLEKLDDDWRLEKLQTFRTLIQENVPRVKEIVSYSMLGYLYNGELLFHLNAQKSHVGFYVSDTAAVDPDGVLLEGLDFGKGCVRFRNRVDINVDNMKQVILNAIALSDGPS